METVACIGIDPGTSKTNPLAVAGIVFRPSVNGCSLMFAFSKSFDFSGHTTAVSKLTSVVPFIYREVSRYNAYYRYGIVERPFVGKSRDGTITLSSMYGVAMYALGVKLYSKNVLDVHPVTAKKDFTGNGRASKQDVIDLVQQMYGVAVPKDEADAFMLATVLAKLKGYEICPENRTLV